MSDRRSFTGLQFFQKVLFLYFDKKIPRTAAAMAYFLLLTLFPFLICVNAFLGLLHFNVADLLYHLQPFLPDVTIEVLHSYVDYIAGHESFTLFTAGLTTTLFSASAAMRTMRQAMADLYDQPLVPGIRTFLRSFLVSIALLLTVYLSLGVIVTGNWFLHWVSTQFPLGASLHIWSSLRFLLLFLVFLLFVLMLTHLAAPKGTPQIPLLVGNVVAAVALVGVSAVFSFFIGLSAQYSLVYGSLVSLIVLSVWLYLCGNILLLGNVLSRVWYDWHGSPNRETH